MNVRLACLALGLSLAVGWTVHLAAAPNPKRLVKEYLKARKDADRAEAWAAIESAPPLDLADVPGLAEEALELVWKRGRKLESGRSEWFEDHPEGYAGHYTTSGKGKSGVVLALHGGGAGSADLGGAVSSFQGAISSLKMRGIYPQALVATEYGWTDPIDTERWVLELLKAARRTWGLDSNRVYVTGHSMGGYGTWTYGSIHADVFAGAAAFAGAPTVYWKPGAKDVEAQAVVDGYLPSLYNLPLFVYQSLDDVQVKPAANVKACADLAALHESDPRGWKHVYEQVDGRGHGFPEGGPGDGLEWMASHERDPRPTKVVWQPVREWKQTFYWLRWDEPWLGAVVTASVDREANTITIDVEPPHGVTPTRAAEELPTRTESLSVYLDDRLIDTERDVVVVVAGEERYRGRPEASLAELVRCAEEREDPEYVFALRAPLARD